MYTQLQLHTHRHRHAHAYTGVALFLALKRHSLDDYVMAVCLGGCFSPNQNTKCPAILNYSTGFRNTAFRLLYMFFALPDVFFTLK